MRLITDFLFLILFFVVLGAWLMLWAMFHLAGGSDPPAVDHRGHFAAPALVPRPQGRLSLKTKGRPDRGAARSLTTFDSIYAQP